MEIYKPTRPEQEPVAVKRLGNFDRPYFNELEGPVAWLALNQDDCLNQQYFTVFGNDDEKLGIVGIYDTADAKNLTHTVVDPKYRGLGLAAKFKDILMSELGLSFITMTIDLENTASITAAEKLPGVKKISDEQFEKDFRKVKYIYETPMK